MMTLDEALSTKKNNVSAIKAAAAWMVIIGHAFAFACNYEQEDFMTVWTDGTYNLGGFAVGIFFFFSGLFIAKSLLSGKYGLKGYAVRRIVRIFPPFIFVTAAIILISGLFITDLDMGTYFSSLDTYRYMLNCIFFKVHDLPGVFTDNIYGTSVNGPIWTIKVEVICYIICYILYKIKLLDKKRAFYVAGLVLAGIITIYRLDNVLGAIIILIRPISMFFMGVLYTIYGDRIPINARSFVMAVIGYAALLLLGFPETGMVLMLPEIICGLAFLFKGNNRVVSVLGKIGEASYEIYLWGGFIGQTVVWAFGGSMSPWMNMWITILAATIVGMLTHWILTTKFRKERA